MKDLLHCLLTFITTYYKLYLYNMNTELFLKHCRSSFFVRYFWFKYDLDRTNMLNPRLV